MTIQVATSGNVANATATATLAANANQKWFLTGFMIDVTGATAASIVSATITGLAGGTITIPVVFPAVVTSDGTRRSVAFSPPIPASTVNTALTLTVPAGGSGNTNASAHLFGYLAT